MIDEKGDVEIQKTIFEINPGIYEIDVVFEKSEEKLEEGYYFEGIYKEKRDFFDEVEKQIEGVSQREEI